MTSHSVEIKPHDSRCRYWAKVVRAGELLPLPVDVQGASDLPGAYLMRGDEELLPGDFLFEGEANHHRKDRGWTYWLHAVCPAGECVTYRSGFSSQKSELKRQGPAAELLKGSGDVAGMVRIAHGLRAGLVVTKSE